MQQLFRSNFRWRTEKLFHPWGVQQIQELLICQATLWKNKYFGSNPVGKCTQTNILSAEPTLINSSSSRFPSLFLEKVKYLDCGLGWRKPRWTKGSKLIFFHLSRVWKTVYRNILQHFPPNFSDNFQIFFTCPECGKSFPPSLWPRLLKIPWNIQDKDIFKEILEKNLKY